MADVSNSIEIPDWVKQVCDPGDPGDLPEIKIEPPRGVEPGSVYLATGLDPATTPTETVLVTAVHPDDGYVEICLAHHDTDAATQYDIALDPLETGMIQPLVLSADVVGVLWLDQLRTRLGGVTTEILQLLPGLSEGRYPDGYGPRVGLPLQGTSDWRWTFKESQIDSVNAICGDCTRRLLDGESRESKWRDPSAAAVISKGLNSGYTEFVTVPEAFHPGAAVCGTRVSSSHEELQGYFDPALIELAAGDWELQSRVDDILAAPGVKPLPGWAEKLQYDYEERVFRDSTGSPLQISPKRLEIWLRKQRVEGEPPQLGEPSQLGSGSPAPSFTVVEEELVAA